MKLTKRMIEAMKIGRALSRAQDAYNANRDIYYRQIDVLQQVTLRLDTSAKVMEKINEEYKLALKRLGRKELRELPLERMIAYAAAGGVQRHEKWAK